MILAISFSVIVLSPPFCAFAPLRLCVEIRTSRRRTVRQRGERPCKQGNESEILAVLKSRLRVAWILKAEDAELTRLGHLSQRMILSMCCRGQLLKARLLVR